MNGISRETFDASNTEGKLGVLFDIQKETYQCVCDFKNKIDKQVCDIDKKYSNQTDKIIRDVTIWKSGMLLVASVSGVVGGFLHDLFLGKVFK